MISLADGLEIGYDDVGQGTPLLLLHGFPHNRALWSPQLGALVDRARCIAPDLRGFGETTVAPPYSMDQYADDAIALLDALRVERAVIGGLSMGGYIAFAIWRRHRARVRGLVLADTRATPDDEPGRQKRRGMIELARRRGARAVADALIGTQVGRTTRERAPEVVEHVRRMLEAAPVEGIVGALEAMMGRPDSTPQLAEIDVPALIVVGAEDESTPPRDARAMHAAIRGSRLEEIDGAGHLSNVERPAAFNHVVSEFLSSLVLA